MRDRTTRDGATTRQATWTRTRVQVDHWRRRVRPRVLRQAATVTRGLRWSPRLVKALLDELHIYDESLALTGASAARTEADLPRLVIVALLLRHSWHPNDLTEFATRVGASAVVPISSAALDPPQLAAPRRGSTHVALAASCAKGAVMTESVVHPASARGHRVRELVCSYRTLRDSDGHVQDVATLALSSPRVAATTLGPLLAAELVEVFAVACLSTRFRLLTWHVVSRGTRTSTQVSMPDVFVPACLTPGTTGIVVVHNHPSGDPSPSADDARLTVRLCAAADVLDLPLIDHLIVGDADRYFSFREAGHLTSGLGSDWTAASR